MSAIIEQCSWTISGSHNTDVFVNRDNIPKHVCTFYIQFILLRLDQERQLLPQIAPLPPRSCAVTHGTDRTTAVAGLCHTCCTEKLELRIVLTKICQICGLQLQGRR